MNVPTYTFDASQIDVAFDAYRVLQKAMRDDPSLAQNPYFTALVDTAYARFLGLFEVRP